MGWIWQSLRTHASRAALAVGLACLATLPAAAQSPRDARFVGAIIRVEDDVVGTGLSVRGLLECLNRFHGPEHMPAARITHPTSDIWVIHTLLRSMAVLHFQLRTVEGTDYAMLRRVEYRVDDRGFAQIVDREAKEVVLRSLCS